MLSQRGKNAVSIGILSALVAFGPLCTDIYLSSLPDISAFYQASPAQTQMSLTSCFIGLALGQIVIGPVSDARGRRGPLLLSLAIFTLNRRGKCKVTSGDRQDRSYDRPSQDPF